MSEHPGRGRAGETPVYDVIGLGFGPANLSLAIAVEEAEELRGEPRLNSLFIERKSGWAWHPSMLLEGAHVQVSFLKDLVTIANPRSRFTFLSYLYDQGRLPEFINLRTFYPTRIEFNDYYSWVARQLADRVAYGREVVSVDLSSQASEQGAELLDVVTRDVATGELSLYRTHDLVVGTGAVPTVPECARGLADARVFHSHVLLERLRERFAIAEAPYHFVVVGSGQSGAEILFYLMQRYPRARVTAAIRRFSYKPLDDSHFVNELFFPRMIDTFYELPEDKRRGLIGMHPDVNTSAVDLDLIGRIYTAIYDEKVAGRERVRVMPFLELQSLRNGGSEVVAEFRDSLHEQAVRVPADAVILATGYSRQPRHHLLENLEAYLEEAGADRYRVQRDYRISRRQGFAPNVFLQGFCEDTHGVADSLLSLMPARAQEILAALLASRADRSPSLTRLAMESVDSVAMSS